MWFSACELAVFLITGDCVVKTEKQIKTFSGKGVAMMHECKRILNRSTASEGLLLPQRATERDANAPMQTFMVPAAAVSESDTESTASPCHSTSSDSEKPGAKPPDKKRGRRAAPEKTTTDGAATEHAGDGEDDVGTDVGDLIAGGITMAPGKKQVFTKTLNHRDDWLHRGLALRDMDYFHYARYIDRIELPRQGSGQSFQKRHGVYWLFDGHYAYAASHVQILRKQPRTVQNVGPQCKRSDVNSGEDNALYKAYFHTCVHCPGADECANPLVYQSLLYPRIDNIDKYLAWLQCTPGAQRIETRFAPAWKARRYEIEVLADRAATKHDRAMRIGVIHDTTLCKGVRVPRSSPAAALGEATEHAFDVRMQQVLVQQIVLRALGVGTCVERVMATIMDGLAVPLPWHRDQPHLAEWQAFSTREILFNLDQTVDARNMAQAQARKRASLLTKDDMDDEPLAARPLQIVEDLGGAPADLDDEGLANDAGGEKHEVHLPVPVVARVLSRVAERAAAGRPGRPRDAHKEMQNVAAVFGPVLDDVAGAFPTESRRNDCLGHTLHDALEQQRAAAETLRREQQGDPPEAAEQPRATSEPGATLLTEAVVELLQSISDKLVEASAQGPAAVAKELAQAAELNRDQLGAVALIAYDMQVAWEAQGKPQRMKLTGRILRMLLLGGGGCGKTRIINLVLTALFLQFWGPRGCVKTAPSNKAARGILGKTEHAAAKIGGGALDMRSLSCNMKTQTALEYLWQPCGALIIDETPQGAAALYHALALRCMIGRASSHELEVADYAEPVMSFGAMPIVVECGDELQLPPVPATAGLFADLAGASTVHLAGVDLFRQKDYVYKLTTMKRFTDPIQIEVLTKMRRKGGCKLTPREWKAIRDTDISSLSATEQQRRLEGTDLWYQSAPTWATVAMAQVIRSRLSAVHASAPLYLIPAQDFVMNKPFDVRLTDAYLAEQIASIPSMNSTGRLPGIAMIHIGMLWKGSLERSVRRTTAA